MEQAKPAPNVFGRALAVCEDLLDVRFAFLFLHGYSNLITVTE